MKPLLHTSCRQVTIRPPVSRPTETRASMADPSGDQHTSVITNQLARDPARHWSGNVIIVEF